MKQYTALCLYAIYLLGIPFDRLRETLQHIIFWQTVLPLIFTDKSLVLRLPDTGKIIFNDNHK